MASSSVLQGGRYLQERDSADEIGLKPSGERLKSHGVVFHENQLLLHVLTRLDAGEDFELTCEFGEGGKFDDIVLIDRKDGRRSTARLIQAKHRKESKKDEKITKSTLLSDRGLCDLMPHFKSYEKDIKHGRFETKMQCEIKDLVLMTNIDFDDDMKALMETVPDGLFADETVYRLSKESVDFVEEMARRAYKQNVVTDDEKEQVRVFFDILKFSVNRPDGEDLKRSNKDKIESCMSKFGFACENVHFVYDILMSHISSFHIDPEVKVIDGAMCRRWLEDAGRCCNDMLSALHNMNMNHLRSHGLRFRNNSLTDLHVDGEETVLFIKSHTCSDITLLKLAATLETRNKKFYLITDEQLIYSKSTTVSESVDLVVVQHGTKSDPNVFLETIRHFSEHKKVVVVSDGLELFDSRWRKIEDRTTLSDFDDKFRELLGRKTVIFQGQRIEFARVDVSLIESHVHDGVLSDLFNGRLEISKRFVDAKTDEMAYFIDRTVKQEGIMKDDELDLLAADEERTRHDQALLFAISNIDEGRFKRIVERFTRNPAFGAAIRFVRLNVENEYEHFERLCRMNQNAIVLWLYSYNGELCLYETGGTLERNKIKTKVIDIEVRRLQCIDDHVLLVAEPGMGKSNLLSVLATRSIQENPDVWVLKIDLDDHSRYFNLMKKEQRSFSDEDTVVEFLTRAQAFRNKFDSLLFRSYFKFDRKMFVLLDGFDEIAPNYRELVTDLIGHLKRNRGVRLWITTRPQEVQYLKKHLQLMPLRLVEFTPIEQRSFFHRFWHERIGIEESRFVRAGIFINHVVEVSRQSLRAPDYPMTGNPLLCRMFGEMYQKNFVDFYSADPNDTGLLPTLLDILEIYRRFIDGIFDRYIEEKSKLDPTSMKNKRRIEKEKCQLIEIHKLLGLLSIFPDERDAFVSVDDLNRIKEYKTEISEGDEKTGIVHSIKNDDPVFIHRTFAEYFTALWFYDRFRHDRSDGRLVDLFADLVFRKENEVVRKFFDLLAVRHPAHRHVLNYDVENLRALLSTNGPEAIASVDHFGRTALHLAGSTYRYEMEDPDLQWYDPNDRRSYEGRSVSDWCLHESYSDEEVASDEEVVSDAATAWDLLMENGADMSLKDALFGWKPIRYQYVTNENWLLFECDFKRFHNGVWLTPYICPHTFRYQASGGPKRRESV